MKIAIKMGRKAAEGTCWNHGEGVVKTIGWLRP